MTLADAGQPTIVLEAVAGPDGLAEIRTLFGEYARSLGIDLGFQGFDAELAALPGKYAAPEGALILARVEGQAAGCVALRPIGDAICEMKRLYVREGYRGRGGLGLGKALVARIIAEAAARGYYAMRLDTLPDMLAAQRLYEAFGFITTEPYVYNPIDGVRYMELRLP